MSGKGASWATFALRICSEACIIGVGTGRAWFAIGLRVLIVVATGRAQITGIVVSVSSCCAATGGGSGDTVHAGGRRCIADVRATGAGIGIWRSAVGDGTGSNPRGVRGGLAFVFGEITDESSR